MDYLVFDIKGGRMIDFHSHVLPGIDDGSDCVEESLEMLHTAKNQGVSTMLATPHFYAQDVSVDHFLEKRKKAYDTLKRCMDDSDCPDIRLGAEVCYFRGIGRAREIEKLCIEGTRVIMVELPFRQWDEEVLRDIEELMEKQNVSVMLAHIERFYACQKRKKIWKEVLDLPVIFQVNAEFFDGRKKRKLIKKLVEENRPIVLGSDCHNTDRRKPNLDMGYSFIREKIGQNAVDEIEKVSVEILEK